MADQDLDSVWDGALVTLRSQMTIATFGTWVEPSRLVSLVSGRATIGVAHAAAQAWMEEKNLVGVIAEALGSVVGEEIEVELEVVGASKVPRVDEGVEYQLELELEGVRETARGEIIKPDVVFVGTKYFFREWLPLLGSVTWLCILALRQRCYIDKKTGVVRNKCKATYEELAAQIGKSHSTVFRALNPEDRTLIDRFILHREIVRGWSQAAAHVVNVTMKWTIRMDEPLIPEDDLKIE